MGQVVQMTWSELDLDPSPTKLRSFALLFLGFAAISAGWRFWMSGLGVLPAALLVGGATVGILGLIRPRDVRPIYLGMTLGTFPLGWILSHILLGLVYFGLFTPLALLFRLGGRDAFRRSFDASADTYLQSRSTTPVSSSYLRPY